MTETPLVPVLQALNTLKEQVRENYPEIPDVTLVVGASGKRKNGVAHAHFHADQWNTDNGAPADEVQIMGESLSRGAEATLGSLIHELTHASANAQGISDTSNQGRYHNKKFKELAEGYGIKLEQGDTIGWSLTTLPEATADLYRDGLDELAEAITTWRQNGSQSLSGKDGDGEDGDETKKSKPRFAVECPICKEPVKVPKQWFEEHPIVCELHSAQFEEAVPEDV